MIENLVELVGIEPTTSSLRTMQSSVHQDCIFKHLYRTRAENESIYWNCKRNVRRSGGSPQPLTLDNKELCHLPNICQCAVEVSICGYSDMLGA